MTLAIYGAGVYGRVFLQGLIQSGVDVDFFIDQYSTAKEISGLPILRMNEVDRPKEVKVLISVALNEKENQLNAIAENLIAEGFCELLIFEQALRAYPKILPHFPQHKILWMSPDKEQMLDTEKLKRVENLLSDEKSKMLLKRIMAFRSSFSVQDYVSSDGQEEYFPDDVPWQMRNQPLRFVDAGAYVGDTVKSCVQACQADAQPLEWIISFEPDIRNIEHYRQEIQIQMSKAPQVQFMLYTSGVYSSDCILSFTNEGNSSSAIEQQLSSENTIAIPANALDSVLYGARPNYLKLDVEGAELQALKGAQKIIQTYTPQLAVCVYHKPADLWELPLYIHSLNPDYDFYLRVHGHMGLSTVLYCIPKQGNL